MMTYIYTGNVEVQPELADELLQAADQVWGRSREG